MPGSLSGDACQNGQPSWTNRTEARQQRLEKVLRQRQDDLTLILANIHDPHNVSAIYRSCDAFGVSKAHLYYTTTAFPSLSEKSSGSARKWVETERHRDAESLFAQLHKENFQILATSFRPGAKPLREWNFLLPTAIILGNEHDGVESGLLNKSDGELYIPMHGLIQSFNVSVAAAIILAEAARQREEAGLYEQTRIANFDVRLREWLAK